MSTKELKLASLIKKTSITVNFNGETHCVLRENPSFDAVLLALREKRNNDIPTLISKARAIEKASGGLFTIKNGVVYVDGMALPSGLGRKIEDFSNEKLPFQPLVAFAKKLQKNPSFHAVQQLFGFLEHNNHPITADGNFIAYKKVTRCTDGVLRDSHSQTFVNDVGTLVKMERNQVDEDPNRTCSNGLHAANFEYAKNFSGDVMVEVEIDPANVVAIPTDYNLSKMRVCQYLVRAVITKPNENGVLVPNKHAVKPNSLDDDSMDDSSDEDEE